MVEPRVELAVVDREPVPLVYATAIAVIEAGGDTEAIITQLLIDIAPAGTNVVAAVQAALDAYLLDPDDDAAVEDLEAVKALKPDFVRWTPKCILDGVDISAKLIGAQDIEFEETAAPVATFSFIPAAGTVDPLMYVGKPVTLSSTIGMYRESGRDADAARAADRARSLAPAAGTSAAYLAAL